MDKLIKDIEITLAIIGDNLTEYAKNVAVTTEIREFQNQYEIVVKKFYSFKNQNLNGMLNHNDLIDFENKDVLVLSNNVRNYILNNLPI